MNLIELLWLGTSDFEAINDIATDSETFFPEALRLPVVPSEPALRQRLEALGVRDATAAVAPISRVPALLLEESAEMVRRHAPALTPCSEDWVAEDLNPSPFGNIGAHSRPLSSSSKTGTGHRDDRPEVREWHNP